MVVNRPLQVRKPSRQPILRSLTLSALVRPRQLRLPSNWVHIGYREWHVVGGGPPGFADLGVWLAVAAQASPITRPRRATEPSNFACALGLRMLTAWARSIALTVTCIMPSAASFVSVSTSAIDVGFFSASTSDAAHRRLDVHWAPPDYVGDLVARRCTEVREI